MNEGIGVFIKVKVVNIFSKPCKKNILFLSDDDKPWFDQKLKQLYRDYVLALCKFNTCKSTENYDNLIVKKRLYKKSELIKKRLYISHEGCRLELLKRTILNNFSPNLRKKTELL